MVKYSALGILLWLASASFAAVPAGTVWELRAAGNKVNAGGFVWQAMVSSAFTWTASGSGTGEFYCKKGAGTCTSYTPLSVTTDGNFTIATEGTAGSLTAGQWDWADNDTLGFSTLYVRLADGADPDSKTTGWVSASAGSDWSQANAAHTSATDLCIVRADTTQVYRSGATKWAAADVNNVIHITAGTGFTAGWYHITTVDVNSDAVLDAAAGTGGSVNGTGYLGGAIAMGDTTVDSEVLNKVVGGNRLYQQGDWTLTETVNASARDFTTTTPARWIGYTTTRGDACVGTDRPALTVSSYYVSLGDAWLVRNLDMTGEGTSGVLTIGDYSRLLNCKLLNNSGTASRVALGTNSSNVVTQCEISSTNGTAISQAGSVCRFTHNFIHDSAIGVTNAANTLFYGNVFYNCTSAVPISTSINNIIVSNTFNSCATSISGNVAMYYIENNIIDNSVTAELNWTTDYLGWCGYNCFGETGPTVTNINLGLGPGNVYLDPGLVNPAAANFTVPTASVVLDAGAQVGTDQGIVGDYDRNIGADQGDHVTATGGSEKTFNVGFY